MPKIDPKDEKIQNLQKIMLDQTAKLQDANRDLARVERVSVAAQLEAHGLRMHRDTLLNALADAQRRNDALLRKVRGCKCGYGAAINDDAADLEG